ncbi:MULTISPECIES: hypothetical protein [unclassified Janthinobacterium]|uniref:hypothetical protein n=1 Tax=unclassified Janthinobacterium TaxID=2610881 RepID=UPI0003467C05|nr:MULTISPECIES: hypothetical protein [unclassified Janthinobacterium]MEC5160234.1 hypothetical protein [Janthinobacterium sp. CG_S6]
MNAAQPDNAQDNGQDNAAQRAVEQNEYRGFTISVTPVKDHDDLWDFEYRIVRDGRDAAARAAGDITRSQTLGGYPAPEVARLAGWEVAKIEVDNLLALEQK